MLDQLLRNAVDANPQKLALICGHRRISYEALDRLIGGFVNGLQAIGLQEAHCVTLLLPNSWEFVVALFAATRLRAIVQPLDPLLHEKALRKRFCDAKPQVIITDREGLEKSRPITATANYGKRFIVIGPNSEGELSFNALIDEANGYRRNTPIYEGRAVYLYTSGSSGTPKRICRTQRNLYYECSNVVQTARLTGSDNILCTIPLHHSYGLEMCLLAAIAAGSTLVMLDAYGESGHPVKRSFAARCPEVLELIKQENIRIFPAVPQQFAALAQLPPEVPADLSGIRLCISSGNALPRDIYDRFLDRTGIVIRQSYGSSEAGTVTLNVDVGDDFQPESVGLPVQNVSVQIVNDDGENVAPGTVGYLWIKSPVMPEHGYDNVSDSKRYGFADGYYRSGDLGLQDARGRLFIRGRQSAFIDTGGYKVEPQEVEEIIKEHPTVREVAVIGVPASDVGEIVKAVIVTKGTGDAQQIQAYCRDRLAGYKVPRIVEFRTTLPRSPLGKILKGELLACHDRPDAGRPDVAPLDATETPAPSLYDEIVDDSKNRVEVLVSRLQTQIAAMLNRASSDISRHAKFEQLGFDSLLATEFCSWLEKSLGVSCPITVVWNYPTPEALARMLLEHLHLTAAPTGLSTGRDGLRATMSTQMLGNLPIAAQLEEIESLSESEVYESLCQGSHFFQTIKVLTQSPGIQKVTQLSSSKKALLALQMRVENQQLFLAEPIAIIGMGCRFPGGANNPALFWKLLADGGSAISEIPADRWDVEAFYHPDGDMPGKMYTRHGGFLSGLDQFDASFFNISPREACQIDPQQRLTLEVAWEALEHAGQTRKGISGSRTGVFIGNSGSEYSDLQMQDLRLVDAYVGTGSQSCVIANRLSYFLNLKGPSLTVDTACSSSLVAMHLACQSLRNGESDLALAGGVNLILMPDMMVALSKNRILSPDGCCKTFDQDANGYVRSEGCGMIVLKRLADAISDTDPIQAVISGTAINQDGKTNGLSAPNSLAQEQVIHEALANAMIEPAQVSCVEAHGTGTRVGDTLEFAALDKVYGHCESQDACFLGAVKTNIGHLEAAAGIAGVIKMTLCLQHQEVPPHRNFRECNADIHLQKTRFQLPLEKRVWQVATGPRRGAVSSFGFGGSNAHVILEEPPFSAKSEQTPTPRTLHMLPLSAHRPEALRELAERYQAFLTAQMSEADVSLGDLCYTASERRDHYSYRCAVIGATCEEMADKVAHFLARNHDASSTRSSQDRGRKVAFVFSGQGQQWWGMGRDLLRTEPLFRNKVEMCDQLFQHISGWSILAELLADEAQSRLHDTAVAQPAIFVLQVALAEWWRSHGITPDAVVGHSVGEVAAAHVAGVLSLEDALRVIYHRGRLMQQATGLGKMAAVRLPAEQLHHCLQGYEDRLAVAAINDPYSTVLAGEGEALEALLQVLQAQGIHSQKLRVNYAFHSPQMERYSAELVRELDGLQTHRSTCSIISTVTGNTCTADDYTATYWGANVRQTVRFADAIARLLEQGMTSFVEISAHPVLSSSIAQGLHQLEQDGCVAESLRRETDASRTLLEALGKLYEAGHDIDWSTLYPSGCCIALPNYPFQRDRYWYNQSNPYNKQPTAHLTRRSGGGSGHPLLVEPLPTVTSQGREQRIWEFHLCADGFYCPNDHRVRSLIVFPAAAHIDLALSAARECFGLTPVLLEHIEFKQALDLPEEGYRAVQLILSAQADGVLSFQIVSHQDADGQRPTSWIQHVSGMVCRSEAVAQDWAEDAVAVQARCAEFVSREAHYEVMRREGLYYGPSYQGVDAIWRCDGEALARLQTPSVATVEGKQCQLHPALLDACFQALSAATPSTTALGDIYLPVGVGKLTFYQVPDTSLWAHVHLTSGGDAQGHEILGDIDLFNQDGKRIAEVRDYRVKRLNPRRPDFLDQLYDIAWVDKPRQQGDTTVQFPNVGSWVLFADQQGVAETLEQMLSEQGEVCHLVYEGDSYRRRSPSRHEVDPDSVESFSELFASIHVDHQLPCRGVVFLWALDNPAHVLEEPAVTVSLASQHCIRALHMTQALLQQGPTQCMLRLWFVTRSGQSIGTTQVDVTQAPLWGLARTIALEHPELRCSVVDLCQVNGAEVASLFAELTDHDVEDQFLLRANARYVARLQPVLESDLESGEDGSQPAGGRPFRLDMDRSGILDHMRLREVSRRRPAPGHIEIEVQAAGLNFLDVLAALGALPDDALEATHQGLRLGAECAGRVVAVGDHVTRFVVGQRVAAIVIDGFATHVTTDARLAVHIPETMTFEEAATIPIVFLTAWQALHHTARLQPGERVLIHAGAGGVGLAAIQIAQYLGAEVFATAGAPEKKAFLHAQGVRYVMNSRSLEFAEQVMDDTGGEGVDVVLNSLAGEFIPKSMSLLRSYGRFIEIGKRDYYENRQIGLRPFLNNLSFSLVDLRAMMAERPDYIQMLFQEVMALFERGVLTPLIYQVFPITRAADAFRLMAQAKHIGKLVMAMDDPSVAILPPQDLRLSTDASYLISGGLGGLGLRLAEWLAQKGARHLVLLSRRAPSQEQCGAIQAIEQLGAQITVVQADVTQEVDVLRALHGLKAKLPPLRGIIHAAGVLDDGMLLNQNAQRFQKVLAPKVNGAWYLHWHTRDEPLDFFVLFSSTAALTGSPGQANYTAANAFLDVLAAYRRQQGRPGLSVNWGPWSEVGMAAAQSNRGDRLARSGLGSLDPVRALQTLGAVLERDPRPQIGVMPVDWEQWAQWNPQNAQAPLYSTLFQVATATTGAGVGALRERMLHASAEEREVLLQDHLLQELAAVLRLPKAQLSANTPLQNLGVDSLMVMELGNRIKTGLGLDIPASKIIPGANIVGLTHVLIEALPQNALAVPGRSPLEQAADDDNPRPPTDELKPLSDAQVEAMLQQMLDTATASHLFEESADS